MAIQQKFNPAVPDIHSFRGYFFWIEINRSAVNALLWENILLLYSVLRYIFSNHSAVEGL